MPASEMVDVFEGLRYGRDPVPAFSPRGPLDTPRELLNFLHDEHGQLWLPDPAQNVWLNFGVGSQIRHVANVSGTNIGTTMLIQLDGAVYMVDTNTPGTTPQLVVGGVGDDRVWVNTMDQAVYIGTGAGTWKIIRAVDGEGPYTSTAMPDQPAGHHSYNYKGRRFVFRRANYTVYFSEINQPETFLEDSRFVVGGDQTGGSWSVHPGSPVALVEHEDVLLLFLTQSVWALTGDSPQNFRLRRTNAVHGCWARDTIVRTDDGIMFLGGTPNGEMGVRLFTGNQAIDVSEEIGGFFRDWTMVSGNFVEANRRFTAVRWRGRYLLSARGVAPDRQVYVYDLGQRKWSTFGGWSQGPAMALIRSQSTAPGLDRLVMTNGNDIYVTDRPLVRAPSAPPGRIILGWHDQGRPAGMTRFFGLKVGAWRAGGTGTLTVTSRVPNASRVGVRTVTTDVHEHAILPIAMRGHAVELELELAASGNALLEHLELVTSRKGEKMSRG
jgi:hypothetical protein